MYMTPDTLDDFTSVCMVMPCMEWAEAATGSSTTCHDHVTLHHISAYTHNYTCICINTCIDTYTDICTYTYTYTYTHTYAYTYTSSHSTTLHWHPAAAQPWDSTAVPPKGEGN